MHHDLSGVLAVNKPAEMTSRRVVDAVAKALGTKSVGHAGTLDPLATGVLVVCVGHATKLVDFIHQLPKAYAAMFLLGRSSPSDDLETEVTEEDRPVRPSRADLEAILPGFRGDILQRPCDYSAVHVGGRRAYSLAREGRAVVLAAKPVRIDRLRIIGYDWPRLEIEVACSSGTFIRALGRDIALALGTSAVMASLVRTQIGPFAIATSLPLDGATPETMRTELSPPRAAVAHLPTHTLAGAGLARAVRGDLLDLGNAVETIAAVDEAGDLVGILRRHETGLHRLRPNFRGAG